MTCEHVVSTVRMRHFFTGIKGLQFIIPDYQRFYDWNDELIKKLFEDIVAAEEKDDEIFLGAILSKQKSKSEEKYYIIDGQQRLLALTIILRCLVRSQKLTNLQNNNIRNWFYLTKISRQNISLNEEKRAIFFQKVICNGGGIEPSDEENPLLHNIVSAVKTIDAEIFNEIKDEIPVRQKRIIQDIYSYITHHIDLVIIELSKEADDIEVYEAINNKRLRLTELDLVKSFLIGECSSQEERKKVARELNGFINNFKNEVADAYNFLEDYLTALSDSKNFFIGSEFKLFETYKVKVFPMFGKDVESALKDILKKQKIYFEITRAKKYFRKGSKTLPYFRALNNLHFLNYRVHIPLIMKLRSSAMKVSDLHVLVANLEMYLFMRRTLFGGKENMPQKIKDDVYDLMRRFDKKTKSKRKKLDEGPLNLCHIISIIKKSVDSMIKDGAEKRLAILSDEEKAQKYVLYRSLTEKLHFIDQYTSKNLEHIFPQRTKSKRGSNDFPQFWIEIRKQDIKSDSKFKKEIKKFRNKVDINNYYYDQYIQGLGNMALVEAVTNSEAKDQSFPEKIRIYISNEKTNTQLKFVLDSNRKRPDYWGTETIRKNGEVISNRYFKEMRKVLIGNY